MVQFGIELGASSHPASGPAVERQYVRRRQRGPTSASLDRYLHSYIDRRDLAVCLGLGRIRLILERNGILIVFWRRPLSRHGANNRTLGIYCQEISSCRIFSFAIIGRMESVDRSA